VATHRPEVIVVTDGDATAWRAVAEAAHDLDLYPLRQSQGNPTPLTGEALVDAIVATGRSPVVVLADDKGDAGRGPGEAALDYLLRSARVRVLGVVAVASHTRPVAGVRPDVSVTADGRLIGGAVDKTGHPTGSPLRGDTVDVLNGEAGDVLVVGLGDPGKMDGRDRAEAGAPATRAALARILAESHRRGERGGAGR
jgi:stage V sporulation protein AE